MRSKLDRAAGLVRRYRVDRRLPPPVLALYQRTTSLRAADRAARAVADGRPPIGDGDGPIARLDGRRLRVARDLDMSTSELGHATATAVSTALGEASVGHFVTRRRGDGLAFGVEDGDRRDALAALKRLDGDAWFLEWADGRSSGVLSLSDGLANRRVARSRSIIVFQAFGWGADVVGRDEGTELTFWDHGTSGQLELIGTRSQERFDHRCPSTTEIIDGVPYPGRTAFPVGANLEHLETSVDIVYTWVDGADPEWLEAFRATAEAHGRLLDEVALDPARYRSRDELKYSLRSVWAYCGWVRTIWVVTAGQRPDWLADHPNVRIVDHSEIIPADALPTFNSHAIEASLHKIEGLAEHFVYFNDDMLVARSTRPELFFTSSGLAKVFQSEGRPPGFEDDQTLAVDTGARRGREMLAERFGRVATAKPYHSPYPLRRSVMVEMENDFPEVIDATRRSRFRSSADVSTAASFAQHYGLATGHGVIADIATEYVHVESTRLDWHLDRIALDPDLYTYCINETSDLAGDHDERENRLRGFFDRMLPIAAPWER